jgi:hypothetical protein
MQERQDYLVKYEKVKTELKHKLEHIKGAESLELALRQKNNKRFDDQ